MEAKRPKPMLDPLLFCRRFRLPAQRRAVEEFQQVQGLRIGHREHGAERGLQPVRLEQLAPAQLRRRLAQQAREGATEAAVRVEAGIQLRVDHPRARGQPLGDLAKTAQASHFQKGHAELALEGTAHGGRVIAQRRQVVFEPAPLRLPTEALEQVADQRPLRAEPLQRPATQAGSEAGLDAALDRIEEQGVLALRLARRAGQAAEHPGALHPDEGEAIVGGVARQQRGIQGVVIGKGKEQRCVGHGRLRNQGGDG